MRSEPASFLHAPVQPTSIGNDGSPFAALITSTHSSLTSRNRSRSSKYLRHATEAKAIAPRGQPVRAGTVDGALRAVGQGFARMGTRDIRKKATGDIDFRIQCQIRGWELEDDPPTRVKSITVQILMVNISLAFGEYHSKTNQTRRHDTIALFYLLQPCEYTGTTNDCAAFRLCDLQLWVGNQAVDVMHATEAQLLAITSASLFLTTQKNGV
jgi:hypothetical protein